MPKVPILPAVFLTAAAQACAAIHAVPDSKVYSDVAYIDHAGPRQQLDLIVPKSPDSNPLPLIVYIHGGAWLAGSRQQCFSYPMINRGYAVAAIDYRYSTDAIWPAQIDDCRAALKFLADHAAEYNIDPHRIALVGDSAGGHLVLMLGLQTPAGAPYTIRGILDFFGPTDLTRLAGEPPGGNPIDKLLGGKVADNLKLAAAASPINLVNKNDPPVLIMHGDNDSTVPIEQSTLLTDAMKKAGASCELITVKNGGHGGAAFAKPEIYTRSVAFFDSCEKP